jgi:hypothetical protein
MNGAVLHPSRLGAARGSASVGRVVPTIHIPSLAMPREAGRGPRCRAAVPLHRGGSAAIGTTTACRLSLQALPPHLFPHRRRKP